MTFSTTNLIVLAVLALVAAYSVLATVRTHLPWARWRVAAMLLCRLALLAAVAAWCVELHISHKSRNAGAELVVIADDSPSISPQGRASIDDWVRRAEQAFSGNHRGWLKVMRMADAAHGSTPIAEALETARATLPGRADKRILLLSDGRATTRDLMSMANQLKNDRIEVFAVPADPLAGESLIADLAVAPAAWRSVPLPIEVTLNSPEAQPCTLTLNIDGVAKEHREVQLPRGNSTVELSATFDADGVHRIEVQAQFKHDRLDWNNSASALVDVPLAPRIIVLSEPPSAATALASVLAANGFQVRLTAPQELPAQFSCDCIVLANVLAKSMTEPRLAAIERYVHAGGAIVFT
ncbi:MAG TPA: vWA domain-containing protein, partial [Humisphaera sp.]|nr:vWA domain-containing protein [Humisphaera sp.]